MLTRSQTVKQLLQPVQVCGFAAARFMLVRIDAPGDTVAVKSQLATYLIELFAIAPARHTPSGQCVEGSARALCDAAKLFVFLLIE